MSRARPYIDWFVGFTAVAWLLAGPSVANAGPWVKAPGEAYAKISGSYFSGTGMFDVNGDFTEPNYEYDHFGLRAYTEIGIFPHVSLTATAPFRRARNARGSVDFIKTGFGDLDVGAKVGTTFQSCALAGVVTVRVPLYTETIQPGADATGATQQQDARDRFIPALGDGSYNATTAGSFGCGIPAIEGWASVEAGPTFRSDGFGTSLSYAATIGSFVIPERLGFKLRVGGIERLETDNRRPTKRYLQLSGGPIVRLVGPLSLEATASYIPTGAFVSRGWSVSTGFSFDGRLFGDPWGGE
jgi:hypothetical protein